MSSRTLPHVADHEDADIRPNHTRPLRWFSRLLIEPVVDNLDESHSVALDYSVKIRDAALRDLKPAHPALKGVASRSARRSGQVAFQRR
jgi:hypothetical protein